MCNIYGSPSEEQLEQFLGLDALAWDQPRWADPVMAPLKPGVFLVPRQDRLRVMLGQWGMIPPGATDRIPRRKPRPGQKQGDRLATNNARSEDLAARFTFRAAWADGRRCLIPATWFQEPYWGITHADPLTRWEKSVPWRFARADGDPWMLAGLWGTWVDPESGELVSHFTMLTQACDGHRLLALMHKPDVDPKTKEPLPVERQDKRTVVPIERGDWSAWLRGTAVEAVRLIRVPPVEAFRHGPADLASDVQLPM